MKCFEVCSPHRMSTFSESFASFILFLRSSSPVIFEVKSWYTCASSPAMNKSSPVEDGGCIWTIILRAEKLLEDVISSLYENVVGYWHMPCVLVIFKLMLNRARHTQVIMLSFFRFWGKFHLRSRITYERATFFSSGPTEKVQLHYSVTACSAFEIHLQ